MPSFRQAVWPLSAANSSQTDCPKPTLVLMVDFADSFRPYEHGIAEACDRHLRNLDSILHLSHEFRKLSSGLDNLQAPSGFTVLCHMMSIIKRNPTTPVDQPLRSSRVRLNLAPKAGIGGRGYRVSHKTADGPYIVQA
jgi:hypothetical protein